ncbi:MAG: DUF2007 domain-containing protein [Bacteroidales bacterium]|nr:DUF2007 domain-containing protein [Bacteroidales bacterium]
MAHSNDLVVVFSGNTFEANLAKNELENNGIPAFLKDEVTGTIAPWHSAPGGVGAVKVTVAQRDIEKANSIIQQFIRRNAERS